MLCRGKAYNLAAWSANLPPMMPNQSDSALRGMCGPNTSDRCQVTRGGSPVAADTRRMLVTARTKYACVGLSSSMSTVKQSPTSAALKSPSAVSKVSESVLKLSMLLMASLQTRLEARLEVERLPRHLNAPPNACMVAAVVRKFPSFRGGLAQRALAGRACAQQNISASWK